MRHRMWVLSCAGLSLLALASFTVGCGSSSDSAKLRLVNATPDESGLDLLVDTKSVATGVGYGAASSYVSVQSGSRQLQVEPSGTTTTLFSRTDTFSSGNSMTLVSLNFSFDISSLLLTDDNSAPASGNFKLRIINASPGMGAQDVYVVTAGTPINSVSATFSSLAFGNAAAYLTLAAGDYEVFFTEPGTQIVSLDSGSLTFSSGQVRTMLALNNPSGAFMSTVLSDAN
jgi:Domain of unknown function (DUF4397)